MLTKILTDEGATPLEIDRLKDMYELAYYLCKFDKWDKAGNPHKKMGNPYDERMKGMPDMEKNLDAAEHYMRLWKEKGLAEYKQLARSELVEFATLAKIARMENPSIALGELVERHDALMAQLA